MAAIHRRGFLYLAGTGLAAATGMGLHGTRAGLVPDAIPDNMQAFSRTQAAMGMRVTLTVLHADRRTASSALDDAFDRIEQVENICSIYRPDSQLSELNRRGRLRNPDPQLIYLLRQATAWSRRSNGAFDVTVQPLWRLYEQADRHGCAPGDDEIQATQARVDWRRVQVGDRSITLEGSGTAVTLNALAQGYAADRVAEVLRSRGIQHALVDTGEIAAWGNRLDGEPWTAGIQHPRDEQAFAGVATLDGRFLATSGDYATVFGKQFDTNHLFDPRTGRSPTETMSVSVVARTALEADALATAISVLSPEEGGRLIVRTPQADVLMLLRDGRCLSTPGFPLRRTSRA